ncbi:CoA-transferase [Bacillus glycinifermentans]|uniref:CoA transferase subunit A n=1 Tax=Bacillus glycinifermentans TaxID=1664069 RepID=A0A0J6E4B3_9BACI|nr:CoA transferase subunit A [Bacillus glycinifermentans]ATH92069.1 CoA transferase subunit A [Bacillus glycinifermentans]KMM62475.1 CoA-transferase [Bacillus glycinifermentans]KRT93028.1 CoA-transferase [Bacillus glycinifermentans]MEC0486667.1 CoA transferase subunit A [Bacillus glycinifermentans]MEC0494770.1 CoA transferase subunit A [Bacillus glycinifermentans]
MALLNKRVSIEDAVADVKDGAILMFGGFGGVGSPPSLIRGILEKGVKNLTVICNDAGFPGIGIGPLIVNNRVKTLIASHIGSNPVAGKQMTDGFLEVKFSPQGTLAERIRAGGVGLGGILTDVGIDNEMVLEEKKTVSLNGRTLIAETALTAEIAFVYGKTADEFGNLTYDKTARNMNPLMAMAADKTYAEVEQIVPAGGLREEEIVTPGIFVDGVVESKGVTWKWVWEH